jgi:hypothetical protein
MREESVFIMNDIEKRMAEDLVQKLSSGIIPVRSRDKRHAMGYEYYTVKNEKIIHGMVLGCEYKLRYKDSDRIFFSAWNCKDAAAVFYDMIAINHILAKAKDLNIYEIFYPFDVDLHTERYVFFATEMAASFVPIADSISKETIKVVHDSQYILSVFEESDKSLYEELIQRFKAEAYSGVQILQVWIRGEILYYAILDGAVMRPEHQRNLTDKEERDLTRKIYKSLNDKFRPTDIIGTE